MRAWSILILFALLSGTAFGQEKEPLFSLLSSIKNSSEYALKKNLIKQELEIAALKDEPKGTRDNKRYANFNSNLPCIKAYTDLKNEVDKLIIQLKADLTISNKKKLIKNLNEGTNEIGSWYKATIDRSQTLHTNLINCTEKASFAASLEEITGVFSALVSVVTSARDFRAQQIKALCEQLDTLRLKDFTELVSAGSGGEKDEKEE